MTTANQGMLIVHPGILSPLALARWILRVAKKLERICSERKKTLACFADLSTTQQTNTSDNLEK